MDKPSYIRNFGMKAWVILVELLLLVSCDNAIYDDEGDCSVTYHLKFRYDMNMKFADAFTHEVKSVRLYAFNSNGELVWQADEQGEILASGDYTMKLELAPGDYHLMAWCGLDNGESFTVTDASHNCRMTDLHCKLNRYLDKATGVSYSNKDLQKLEKFMQGKPIQSKKSDVSYCRKQLLTQNLQCVEEKFCCIILERNIRKIIVVIVKLFKSKETSGGSGFVVCSD